MMKMRVTRLLLVALGGVLAACAPESDVSGPGERAPTKVLAERVELARFASGIEALGTSRSNESLDVSANLTEKIIALNFEDGAEVEAGDLLARLDDTAERAALAAARARLAERRRTLDRSESLVRDRVLSESEVDLLASEVETAAAEVTALEVQIEDHQIRAPFAGRVGLRMVSVGALIQPGDVITTLDDIDTIKVDFTVPETELARLQAGVPLVARWAALASRPDLHPGAGIPPLMGFGYFDGGKKMPGTFIEVITPLSDNWLEIMFPNKETARIVVGSLAD